METDVLILILRMAFAALLYLFLFAVAVIVYRDLRHDATGSTKGYSAPLGRMIVLDNGQTSLIPGQTFEMQPVTSLGRGPTNTIVVPDGFASHEHALLMWRDQQWWIEDLGSTNGTLLNRRLVDKPIRVNPGDIVQVGGVKLKLIR